MTTAVERAAEASAPPVPRVRWNRPLLGLAVAMVGLAAFAAIARFTTTVEIAGLNQWDKPLKFALSTAIYAVTWSWLIGQLTRFRRLADIAAWTIVAMFAIELAIIVWAAVIGTTSHFNVTTPLHTTMWSIMAVSITVLWVASFVAATLLFTGRIGDRARTLAIRAGAVLSLVGLGLGYLMTAPTADQLADFQGIAGAHTVGLADGGPGLPILGWSTVAGDLRIPHFVGMHALQVLPLALIAIEALARRWTVLRDVRVRTGLVAVAAALYAGVIALVTWQALRGQSIVQPDAATLVVGGVIAVAAAVSAGIVIGAGARRARGRAISES